MTRLLIIAILSVFSIVSQAEACNCASGAKAVLKDVNTRESSIITSRDGTPLKAKFYGANEVKAPVAVAPKAPMAAPAPVTVSSDTQNVKSFRLEFASNAKTPNTASLEQMAEIKKMLASGEFKTVNIVGFADQTGSPAYNNKLSLTRAQEVAKMVKSSVAKSTKMSAMGGGVKDTTNLDSARVVEVQFVK
jgi:outer membrane protein OmpA-like peptidoglycan-associated protein